MITDETRGVGEMNREDIDTLWQQALIESINDGEQFTRYHFAALVAAAEREACAKVCDDKAKETFSGQCQVWGDYFARAIRARGEK
jgi:hypothetical protein